MPYAITNLKDGERPSAHAVSGPEEVPEGHVYVPLEEFDREWRWDGANKRLRDSTLAERVGDKKREKMREFARSARWEEDSLLADPGELSQKRARARGALEAAAKKQGATPEDLEKIRWEDI